ncbi:MAG: hypothetical protein HC836_46390, partial [Richelia sp. RM2_1_2]|nr:hypothetical protein [Richelia sp. RM2_1_2]
KPYLETAFDASNKKLDEAEIVEDQISEKPSDDKSITEKKKEDELKLKKVADLLNRLPKNEINKLVKLLEYK